MENEWLRINQAKIKKMQHLLTELAYKNENPGVPIGELRGLMGAAFVEISKLQKEVESLRKSLINATKKDTIEPDRN